MDKKNKSIHRKITQFISFQDPISSKEVQAFDSSDKTQISVTNKAVIMCNNNEIWIDQQHHVLNYAL